MLTECDVVLIIMMIIFMVMVSPAVMGGNVFKTQLNVVYTSESTK